MDGRNARRTRQGAIMNSGTNEIARATARIRKMLALAADAGATEGERDSALRMAHATMIKYNLDAVEMGAAAADDPRSENDGTFLGFPWSQRICVSVARLMFCRYYLRSPLNGKRY